MKRAASFLLLLVFAACSGPSEKWIRYTVDDKGKMLDTLNIIIYPGKIELEAGANRSDGNVMPGINTYTILDSVKSPDDARKTIYLLETHDGIYLTLFVFRAEPGRTAINWGDLYYGPGSSGVSRKPDLQREAATLFEYADQGGYQGPFFYSEALVNKWQHRPGFVSVNCDTVMYYLALRNKTFREQEARFRSWGTGKFISEEPTWAVLDEKGYDPFRAYQQIIMSGCFNPHDDSLQQALNDEYLKMLFGKDVR